MSEQKVDEYKALGIEAEQAALYAAIGYPPGCSCCWANWLKAKAAFKQERAVRR